MAGKRGRSESNDDDGFVVNDPNADAPQSNRKKAKNGNSGNVIKRSEGKSEVSTSMQKDEDGNEYWEISKLRRVQISNYKGKYMVNIREFYEKDGKHLPGKKGISLPIDQFAALLDIIPDIEAVLEEKGENIPRAMAEKDEREGEHTDMKTSKKEAMNEEEEEQQNACV